MNNEFLNCRKFERIIVVGIVQILHFLFHFVVDSIYFKVLVCWFFEKSNTQFLQNLKALAWFPAEGWNQTAKENVLMGNLTPSWPLTYANIYIKPCSIGGKDNKVIIFFVTKVVMKKKIFSQNDGGNHYKKISTICYSI